MTEKIIWDASYSVGNATLDKQHQKLLDLCSKVADCLGDDGQDSHERFHMVLNDVGDFAFEHFKTEEAFLRQHNYPQLERHKAEHIGLLSQLSAFFFAASAGVLDKSGLYRCLSDWLSQHMLESDMQYREFLQTGKAEVATN